MLNNKSRDQATSRTLGKSRRFNSSIFDRSTVTEQPTNIFSLCEQKQQYKERRSQAEALHSRSSKSGLANAILSLICVVFAFLDNEMTFYDNISTLQSAALRSLIICFSVIQGALTIQNERNWLSLQKILGFKHQSTSMALEKKRLYSLVLELLHLCLILPPGYNAEASVTTGLQKSSISLEDAITVAIALRLFHVVKYVYSQSPYLMPRAQFYTYASISALHGVYDQPLFIVIGQITTHPFMTLFAVGITVVLLSGVLFHIAERNEASGLLLYDGPWFIAITQLTVGYGEMYPQTDFGRAVAIGPGLLGVCTLSLVVSCALGQLQLSRTEKKMVDQLYNTQQTRTKLLPVVAVFLQRMWRFRLARKQKVPRIKEVYLFRVMLRIFRTKFSAVLASSSPELGDQINIFHSRTKKVFKVMNRRLRPLEVFSHMAGSLATDNFQLISALLSSKRVYLRLKRLFARNGGSSFIPLRRLRGINKAIIYKMNREVAVRRLKERVATRKEKQPLVVVVDEESVSANGSDIDITKSRSSF